MSMLIQISVRGWVNEMVRPTFWCILGIWIAFVAYWLRRLDKGLELFPPLFIIPIMQVFFVFFAILCGGIFFQEFNSFTTYTYVGFVIGVAMILLGVYGLAPEDTDPCADVQAEEEEILEAIRRNSNSSLQGSTSQSSPHPSLVPTPRNSDAALHPTIQFSAGSAQAQATNKVVPLSRVNSEANSQAEEGLT